MKHVSVRKDERGRFWIYFEGAHDSEAVGPMDARQLRIAALAFEGEGLAMVANVCRWLANGGVVRQKGGRKKALLRPGWQS